MTDLESETSLPPIVMSEADFDALERIVGNAPETGPAELLRQELDRAEVRADVDMPRNVVTLNRWLHYADGRGGDSLRRIRLVQPREADIDTGQVSILSYVGAGLIGLQEGQAIEWPDPSGTRRRLTPVLIEDEDVVEAASR